MPLTGYRKHYVEAVQMTHLARYCPLGVCILVLLLGMWLVTGYLNWSAPDILILLGLQIYYSVSYSYRSLFANNLYLLQLLCMDNQPAKLCVIGNCLAVAINSWPALYSSQQVC